MTTSALAVTAAGIDFQNPVLLAAGTAAYGRELSSVIDLDSLGGSSLSVSVERRHGARAPRVASSRRHDQRRRLGEPGVEEVREAHLPWLAQTFVAHGCSLNVVGNQVRSCASVIALLDDSSAVSGL